MISFVYFDVGGVVVKELGDKWTLLKRDLGIKPENDLEFDKWFDTEEDQMCIGMQADEIVPKLRTKWGLALPDNYSFLQDMVNRFGENLSIRPVIKKIRDASRTGLLTNMYPNLLNELKQRKFLPNFDWEIIIDSSIEKVAKPDRGIFEIAQKRAGVPANEILFVENTKRHIDAASSLGWQTFWYDSKNTDASSAALEKFVETLW